MPTKSKESEITVQLEFAKPAELEPEEHAEELPEWEFLGVYQGEEESVLVAEYPKIKARGILIGADDLVTPATTIYFKLIYPLENPARVTASCPNGFTRLHMTGRFTRHTKRCTTPASPK